MATTNDMPHLFVVDGSNIATEGSDKPSLEQLNEAVDAFRSEYPKLKLTVVVDATFGHRIAKKEVKAFDQAVANNEIVTPPAGAVGRGDAFILAIADKAGAGVLSNDSFQEFHGEYGWLFEHGRLIGGKPVPHVGWVFVDRNPVRGRRSRESIKAAKQSDSPPTEAKEQARRRVRKKKAAAGAAAEPSEEQPLEVTSPEEDLSAPASEAGESRRSRGGRRRGSRGGSKRAAGAEAPDDAGSASAEPARGGSHVNELMPFLDFVEQHPVGTSVSGTVDSYSSHGAYAKVGDVQVYVPLRLMAKPAPTSARKVLTVGDPVELVIVGFVPDRRSIDGALPGMADVEPPAAADTASDDEPAARGSRKQAAPKKRAAARKKAAAKKAPATKRAPAKRSPAKKQAAAKKAPAKRAAKTTSAEQTPAKKTPAKRTPARKAPAKKKAAAKKAPAKKKAAAKKAAAKKAPATTAARKAPAKRRARRSSRGSGAS